MFKIIDINPSNWYFQDITEFNNISLYNGMEYIPSISGIPYNQFNSPALDYVTVNTSVTSEIYLPTIISPTEDNPVKVWVNNIEQTVLTAVTRDNVTVLNIAREMSVGSDIRVIFNGEPKYRVLVSVPIGITVKLYSSDLSQSRDLVNGESFIYYNTDDGIAAYNVYTEEFGGTLGKIYISQYARKTTVGTSGDVYYPLFSIDIPSGNTYYYDPYNSVFSEKCTINGVQLKRIDDLDDMDETSYRVASGNLFVHYSLNNEIVELTFMVKNSAGTIRTVTNRKRVHSDSMLYTNRFFPDMHVTRAEIITFLDRMRLDFLSRYTDFNPTFNYGRVSRFTDIQTTLDNSLDDPWWWQHLKYMEKLKMPDGSYLISGYPDGELKIDLLVSRADAVVLLDKFRTWCIESFK